MSYPRGTGQIDCAQAGRILHTDPLVLPILCLNDRSVMVNDLPAFACALPNDRAAGPAHRIQDEGVGQQIDVRGQPSAVEFRGFPHVGVPDGITSFQFIEHIRSRIAPARSPHFPEVIQRHLFRNRRGLFPARTMKNRFAAESSARISESSVSVVNVDSISGTCFGYAMSWAGISPGDIPESHNITEKPKAEASNRMRRCMDVLAPSSL